MKKILVVDDEVNVTELIKAYLETTGKFQVKTENSGERGYACAQEFHPDLILLDIMMSDTGGDRMAEKIKNDVLLQKIPIVFLTGIVTKEEVQANDGVIGGYPYIAKPILAMHELVDCIEANIP